MDRLIFPRARRHAALLLAIGFTAAMPASAIDLRQAYDAAFANDATIRASRAAATATRERLPQARAQQLPQISLNAGRNYNDLVSTTNYPSGTQRAENDYYSGNQSLNLRLPLYRPYLYAQTQQAKAQVDDANALLERDEQTLIMRVSEAYFEALLARDQVELLRVQKASNAVQLDAARKNFAAGAGTRTDIDEAQARLDLTLAQDLETQQNVEFTQRRLEVLTGQSITSLAPLDVQRFTPESPQPARMEDWIARAEDASPELHSLRAQTEAARQEVEKAKTGHLPTLDAVASWSRSHSDSVSNITSRYKHKTVGLQLSIPLYSGGAVNSQVRQALASEERAREVLESARRDLGVQIHQEFRAMTEGLLRIRALEQAVRSAQQALLSNQKSLAAGSRTTLDVLNAEQQKTTALRDLAQARYRYLLAGLRLQTLAGNDREHSIQQTNAWLEKSTP